VIEGLVVLLIAICWFGWRHHRDNDSDS